MTEDKTPAVRARITDAPYALSRNGIELYVAGARVPASSTRYFDGTLSYTSRPLAVNKITVRAVATDGAGNTAGRSWASRVR